MKVDDDDEEEGFRYYCSKECQKNDSAEQTTCRPTNSKETDEPGCGREVTEANNLQICQRTACGKRRFCKECSFGYDQKGNRTKLKGKSLSNGGDTSWWWCSKECKRLDDEVQGDRAKWRKYEDDDDDEDDDSPPPTTKKSAGKECQNEKCKKTFNDKTKRAECKNPDCMDNRDFCEPCTHKFSKPPNGWWVKNPEQKIPDRWFCSKRCRDAIEIPLDAATEAAEAAEQKARTQKIQDRKKKEAEAAAKAKKARESGEEEEGEDADAAETEKLKAAIKDKKKGDEKGDTTQEATSAATEDARQKRLDAIKKREEKKKATGRSDRTRKAATELRTLK